MAEVRVTILVENTARGRGILAEHGLAFWIEFAGRKILFDTGQSGIIFDNAKQLGIPLEQTQAIVLSHGHYDHTGGLARLLDIASDVDVYTHPAAFAKKFASNSAGDVRTVGMVNVDEQTVRDKCEKLVWTTSPTEICPGLFVTGEIPRITDYENTGGLFFLDESCQKPDPIIDDQAMFFDSREGTVVLLGCAHSGVINTLKYIRKLTNGRPIHAVIGGMHLVNATKLRIDRTIEALRELNIAKLTPVHCTGQSAICQLWHAMPEQYVTGNVGTTMEFEVL